MSINATSEENQDFVKEIRKLSVDFDGWYNDVVRKAEIADWSGVRGCMVVRPYGYAIWENIQRAFDDMIKETGHENMAFPMLIPRSLFAREAEHIEGFAPEVAWVTKAGSGMEELEEPLVVRPTSETIIGPIMKRYIQSYRDLPKLTNQWCSVFRWEMRSRLLLRTREFWWQEGHTFHATAQEAQEEVDLILGYYADLAEQWLAIPVLRGRKSESEKFAGAEHTKSIEGMMRDGMALQAGTSHYFGQNFSRAYDVSFANKENQKELCYTTSWGTSTRLLGGLIMAHGDDSGLIMPPRIAPIQVVVIPIFRDDEGRSRVSAFIDALAADLKAAGVRAKVDWRDERPGAKYAEWELKGVPLRVEVGPRDVDAGQVMVVDRLSREKRPTPIGGLGVRLRDELEAFHAALFQRALEFRESRSRESGSYEEFKALFAEGNYFVTAGWCGSAECEAKIKEETGATTRNYDEGAVGEGVCVLCGKRARHRIVFARSY